MRKIFFLVIICFLSLAARSQGYLWAKAIGIFNNGDLGQSVAFDSQGNMYVTGYFNDSIDCDPGPGVTNLISTWGKDLFINKYGINGQFLWAKKIGGPGHDEYCYIAIDSADNLFVTGVHGNPADFDPGPGSAFLSALGGSDIFLAKYDNNGNYIWAKRMGGSAIQNEFSQSISIDNLGNIIISGMFQDTADFDPGPLSAKLTAYGGEDGFVAKYDNNGNYLWAKGMGGALSDVANDAAADSLGNVYVTGHFFSSTSDFDPGVGITNLSASGLNDIFISKFDANGNFMWAKKMGAGSYDEANSIAVDPSGNFYITGYFGSTVDFNPDAGVNTLIGSGRDIFLSKYDPNGNYIWAKKAGGSSSDEGNDVKLDALGDVYCTGHFVFTANFSVTPAINLTAVGSTDIFIAKYTSAGVVSWAKGMGGIGQDYALSIAVISGSAIGITGAFNETADFDPSASVANLISTGPASDICFAKYCTAPPVQPTAITGNLMVCASSNQTYSIANVNDAISYTWQLPGGWTGTSTIGVISVTAGTTGGAINVRANNSCGNSTFQTINITVSNPSLALSSTDVMCGGECTGSITPIPLGGIGTYTYSPSVLTNICEGTHTIILTDSIGCTATANALISGPSAVIVNTTQTNVSCNGLCDGTIATSVTGGIGPYTYSATMLGLCAGTYTVIATDANGCTGSAMVIITEPPLLPITTITSNTSCNGVCDGTAVLTVAGETSGYTFLWCNGITTPSISGLCSGPCSVIVTDTNGCETNNMVVISSPSPVTFGITATPNSVCEGNCSFLDASPTGGTSPYAFAWTPSLYLNDPNILNPTACPPSTTTYTVNVTDANGCSLSDVITIAVNPLPTVIYTQDPSVFCDNIPTVILSAGSPAGGLYSGTTVSINTFSPSTAGGGTYNISYAYTDGNGCINSDTSTIIVSVCASVLQNTNENEIIIYPIPSHNFILVRGLKENAEIKIFNVLGVEVLYTQIQKDKAEIDLSELSNGIYFLEIQTQGSSYQKKIIKG